jgi:hypothetical protein
MLTYAAASTVTAASQSETPPSLEVESREFVPGVPFSVSDRRAGSADGTDCTEDEVPEVASYADVCCRMLTYAAVC